MINRKIVIDMIDVDIPDNVKDYFIDVYYKHYETSFLKIDNAFFRDNLVEDLEEFPPNKILLEYIQKLGIDLDKEEYILITYENG